MAEWMPGLPAIRGLSKKRPGQRARTTPAAIMAPRIVYVAVVGSLVLFGLLMIYSSSSITGLVSDDAGNDPAFYLERQTLFVAAGIVVAAVLARVDYHVWRGRSLEFVWFVSVAALAVLYTGIAGKETNGASRWIAIGALHLQPSEFAKITILLAGAYLAEAFYAQGSMDAVEFGRHLTVSLGIPLALILFQPDKGTTGVLVLTLMVMVYLCGVSGRTIASICAVGLAVALLIASFDPYARARILTMVDPFRDPWGDGYQLVQGFYALGSGGLTGLGLGMSRQKYNYLPMAHNDFIFAVVGEELGFLGTLGLLAAFVLLLWSGLKIAEHAPDLTGRLIAAGCTSLLVIQLLLNVSGVLGVFPLSGKPVPFVSYGGSSVLSSLMLAGLVLSVSLRSTLPETESDKRRSRMRLAQESGPRAWGEQSFVGEAEPRSARRRGMVERTKPLSTRMGPRLVPSEMARRDSVPSADNEARRYELRRARLHLVEPESARSPEPARRGNLNASVRRVDLGPSPAQRLRQDTRSSDRSRRREGRS